MTVARWRHRSVTAPACRDPLLDYALSQEGQQTRRDRRYSVRADVTPPAGLPALSDLNILAQDGSWTEYRTRQDRLQTEYGQLFHPDSE